MVRLARNPERIFQTSCAVGDQVDEAEEKEKTNTLVARKDCVDKCCEKLSAKTEEMKGLLAQGVFSNIAAITSEIQESEQELKTLHNDIGAKHHLTISPSLVPLFRFRAS